MPWMFPTGAGTSPLDGFGQHVLHSSVAEMIREKWEVNTWRILQILTGNMVDNHGIVRFLGENHRILQLMNGYTITWRIIPRILHSVRIHLNSWDTTILGGLLTIGFLPLTKWNDPPRKHTWVFYQTRLGLKCCPTDVGCKHQPFDVEFSIQEHTRMPKKSGQQQLPLGWAYEILIDFSCQDGPIFGQKCGIQPPRSVFQCFWVKPWKIGKATGYVDFSRGSSAKVAVTAASQMLGHALHVHASGPAGPIKSHTLGMGFMKGCCLKNHRQLRSLATRNDIEMYLSSVCLYSLYRHMATHGDTWLSWPCAQNSLPTIPSDSTKGDPNFFRIAIHPCAPDTRKSTGKTKLQAPHAARSGNPCWYW